MSFDEGRRVGLVRGEGLVKGLVALCMKYDSDRYSHFACLSAFSLSYSHKPKSLKYMTTENSRNVSYST